MPLSSVSEGIQYALKFNTAFDFKLKSYFHSEHEIYRRFIFAEMTVSP